MVLTFDASIIRVDDVELNGILPSVSHKCTSIV